MVKCQTIKMEFTSGSSNSFDVSTKIYGTHIECSGKAAGKIGENFFSAKYRFNIDARTLKICSIHFTDVTHVGKTDIPQYACDHYYYYYDINSSDSSSSYSDIIDDTFEQTVYNALYYILSNGVVTQSGVILTINLTNSTTSTTIDYLVLHIKIGAHSYGSSSSACNENSISDAISKSCGKSSSSHKKSSSSCTTSLTTSKSSSKSSKSSKSKKHKKKHKKSMQKILKVIAWSLLISFIMFVLKIRR